MSYDTSQVALQAPHGDQIFRAVHLVTLVQAQLHLVLRAGQTIDGDGVSIDSGCAKLSPTRLPGDRPTVRVTDETRGEFDS